MDTDQTFLVPNGIEILDILRNYQRTHTLKTIEQLGTTRVLLQIKPMLPNLNKHGSCLIGITTTQKGQYHLTQGLMQVAEQVIYMVTGRCLILADPLIRL